MTRIVLRPIGSPLPLGFFTVAIDNVLVSALQSGVLPVADGRAVALIVFPAFIVQAIAGLFALAARDSIAGTLMLSFAAAWLIDALVFSVEPPVLPPRSESSRSCSRSSYRSCWPARSLKRASPPSSRRRAAVPDRWHRRYHRQSGGSRRPVPCWASSSPQWHCTAFALLLEDFRGREVLPIGRSGAARQAARHPGAELRSIERRPGVRRTL